MFLFLQQLPPSKKARAPPGELRKTLEPLYLECPGLLFEFVQFKLTLRFYLYRSRLRLSDSRLVYERRQWEGDRR